MIRRIDRRPEVELARASLAHWQGRLASVERSLQADRETLFVTQEDLFTETRYARGFSPFAYGVAMLAAAAVGATCAVSLAGTLPAVRWVLGIGGFLGGATLGVKGIQTFDSVLIARDMRKVLTHSAAHLRAQVAGARRGLDEAIQSAAAAVHAEAPTVAVPAPAIAATAESLTVGGVQIPRRR